MDRIQRIAELNRGKMTASVAEARQECDTILWSVAQGQCPPGTGERLDAAIRALSRARSEYTIYVDLAAYPPEEEATNE